LASAAARPARVAASAGAGPQDQITPHWFAGNARFWYRNDLAAGAREFVAVDTTKATRGPAFDHKRLAAALAKAIGKDVPADKLPFDLIALDDHAKAVRFKVGDTLWKCDLPNVPPESTFRLADALIRAGKDFDFVVAPNANHGMGGAYGQRRMLDFFVRHLKGAEPPDRNDVTTGGR